MGGQEHVDLLRRFDHRCVPTHYQFGSFLTQNRRFSQAVHLSWFLRSYRYILRRSLERGSRRVRDCQVIHHASTRPHTIPHRDPKYG